MVERIKTEVLIVNIHNIYLASTIYELLFYLNVTVNDTVGTIIFLLLQMKNL